MRRWCCSRKRRNGKLWRALAGMTLDERVALAESGFRPTRYADLTAITLVGLVGRLVDRRPGQPHRARARLDTGMHVYDAELLRVRAHTYTNLDAAPPAFTPPANWPAARARRCSNCVPPSMISSHAASPPVPHSLTLSASSPPTTYCLNWRSPRDTGFTLTEERVAIPGEGMAYAGSKPLCQRASTDLVRGVFCVSARITAPMDRTADKRDVALRLRSQLKDVRVCLRLGLPARYLRSHRPGADGGDRRLVAVQRLLDRRLRRPGALRILHGNLASPGIDH